MQRAEHRGRTEGGEGCQIEIRQKENRYFSLYVIHCCILQSLVNYVNLTNFLILTLTFPDPTKHSSIRPSISLFSQSYLASSVMFLSSLKVQTKRLSAVSDFQEKLANVPNFSAAFLRLCTEPLRSNCRALSCGIFFFKKWKNTSFDTVFLLPFRERTTENMNQFRLQKLKWQ